MQHLAIMQKSWGLLPKIVSGGKTIESRWYLNKSAPWGKVKVGDTIYFKNSGESVATRATVNHVLQFADLTPTKVQSLLDEYGGADGIEPKDIPTYYERFKDKRYCILIFLRHVQLVEPFNIDKSGFGAQAAWVTASSIEALRI